MDQREQMIIDRSLTTDRPIIAQLQTIDSILSTVLIIDRSTDLSKNFQKS